MKNFIVAAVLALVLAASPAMAAEKSRAALQADYLTYKLRYYDPNSIYSNLYNTADSCFNLTTDDINDITGSTTITNLGTVTTTDINGGTIDGVAVGTTAALTALVGPGEVVAATNVLAASECGKKMTLAHATEFATTLPSPSLGCEFSFIVGAAPFGASYTVVTTGADIIYGVATAIDGGSSGQAEDTITFVNGQAVVGDRVDIWSDGTNWHAIGFSSSAAGITFTSAI